jgi:hypothetical protein
MTKSHNVVARFAIGGVGVGNKNPYQARLASAMRRKPMNLEQVRQRTSAVLIEAYLAIGEGSDEDTRRKAMLCYSQIAMAYAKLWEVTEIEARLSALEASLAERNGHL